MRMPWQPKQLPQERFPWQEPMALAQLQALLASPGYRVLRLFLDHHIAQMLSPIPPQGETGWVVLRAHQDGGHLALKNLKEQLEYIANQKPKE